MILKVERAPEDSPLAIKSIGKVLAAGFINYPPMCVQRTIQASQLRSTMREGINGDPIDMAFFLQIHFCISFITCNLIFLFEILDLAEAMFCPSTSSQESSFGRR